MRIFKTKWFARFARKEHINDEMLVNAIREIERGLADGELGAELVKKRIARIGEGKRGGYRTIIAYRGGFCQSTTKRGSGGGYTHEKEISNRCTGSSARNSGRAP